MADEQGRGTGALNFERIYSTTVPAEEVARALADHFRMQDFEAQVYRSNENRTVMQARKESLWRQLLGVLLDVCAGTTRAHSGLRARYEGGPRADLTARPRRPSLWRGLVRGR